MSPSNPTLSQVNVISADPAASIAFYRRLGIAVPDDAVWRTPTGIHHANAGGASGSGIGLEIDSIAFGRIWNSGWRGRDDLRGRLVLGFRVASRAAVEEIYADLTGAGYAGLQTPYDAFWGARYAVIEDPDGIAVGLMSPVSAQFRSAPPEV
jgi:catechol 2,3-dioxygenase-like lactoylglutathione lyase family enzyme